MVELTSPKDEARTGHRRVLAIACEPRDLGEQGAALARHAERGDLVRALVVCGGQDAATPAVARAELRPLGLARERTGGDTELVARLAAEIAEFAPDLVRVPSPLEGDLARRAAVRAALAALAGGPPREIAVSARADRAGEREHVLPSAHLAAWLASVEAENPARAAVGPRVPQATAVISTWNKKEDLRANLAGLRSQTLPFAAIVVVDNASRDGTAEMVAAEFPEVRLIRMPHDRYGACETFNIGFASATTELVAILDDDIVMPPEWLEKSVARMLAEPPTTAILSTQVIEPGMPESYRTSKAVNEERYMSTFRGCASLARTEVLRAAGFYDERLFLYGNERDLTCRVLNLGYRVLQYPGAGVFHRTPFGIKMGKRSLYFHARNAWLSMLKYAPASDLARMPWLVFSKVVLRGEEKEAAGTVTDAVGTIGIGRSLRETPGAWWVVTKALFSVLANVPYCLKHRRPCKAGDFELPLH